MRDHFLFWIKSIKRLFRLPLRRLLAAALSVLLCLLPAGCSGTSSGSDSATVYKSSLAEEDMAISESIQFLKEQESVSPEEVENELIMLEIQKIADSREEILDKVKTTDMDELWYLFDNYLLIGNSRCLGFSYIDLLPESKVIAGTGYTIYEIGNEASRLVEMAPVGIYFCFGINEMTGGQWSADGFVKDYEDELLSLQEQLPQTTFYVCSILPTDPSTYEDNPEYANVATWNQKLKEMCERNHFVYVDNDRISDISQYYAGDGIHFDASFYPVLAKNMLISTYSNPTRAEYLLSQEQQTE